MKISNQQSKKSSLMYLKIITFLIGFIIWDGHHIQSFGQSSIDTEFMENEIPESASLLSEYLQFASVTGHEKSAGMYLANLCTSKGLHVEHFSEAEDQYNFAASIYPLSLGLPNIIFLNHIDVVPSVNEDDWIYGPFSGQINEGIVWGRGAIDMKSMAIMQLLAIEEFARNHQNELPSFNVTLLCVSDEEDVGSKGAKWVLDNYLDYLNPTAVFGEGGSGVHGIIDKKPDTPLMFVSIGEKKAVWLEITIDEPTSGHGAVPPCSYANHTAVDELCHLMNKKQRIYLDNNAKNTLRIMGKCEKGTKGFIMKNIALFKPIVCGALRKNPMICAGLTNTMTLTNIYNPAGSFNEIAQKTIAQLDCRLLPDYSTEKFIDKIKRRFKSDKCDVNIIYETENGGFSEEDENLDNLSKAIKAVYPKSVIAPILFPAITDNHYFRSRGIPSYGLSPVCLDEELLKSVHNINERIPIKCLEKGIDVYVLLLDNYMESRQLVVKNDDSVHK